MKKSLVIHPHELSRKWIDKMADMGVDTLGIHPVGGVKAHETLNELIERLNTAEFRNLIDYACRRGLSIEYELHAASYLLPRELFATNPEYFRMDENGNRTTEINLCASNHDALEFVCKRAVELAKLLYRSSGKYYFWLDDARHTGCCCPKCREYSDSDQQLMILNAVLKALRLYDPDAKLAYLAYFSTITPPEKVAKEDGIFVEYAPIERDFKTRLSESDQADVSNIKSLVEFFGRSDAKVLEYWLDNSLFSGWKPDNIQKLEPDNSLIRDDIHYYNSLGFEYISTFACYLGEDYEALYGEPDISGFCNS